MVVMGTDGNEVVEVGAAALFPLDEVMHFTSGDRHLTSGNRTGAVDGLDRSSLSNRREAAGASDGDRYGAASYEHRNDVAGAGRLTCCVDIDCCTVGTFAHGVGVSAVDEGVSVDDDRDRRAALGRVTGAGDEVDKCVCHHVIAVLITIAFHAATGLSVKQRSESVIRVGIEGAVEVPHAGVTIEPVAQTCGGLALCLAGNAEFGGDAGEESIAPAAELRWGERHGVAEDLAAVGTESCDDLNTGSTDGTSDDIEMVGAAQASGECVAEFRETLDEQRSAVSATTFGGGDACNAVEGLWCDATCRPNR